MVLRDEELNNKRCDYIFRFLFKSTIIYHSLEP